MSKVKIQGNVGGTGNFTIATPATNTDRTITLPDVDATVLTTAGGAINGPLAVSGNLDLSGTGDILLGRTDGYDSSITMTASAVNAGKKLIFQKLGGGDLAGIQFNGRVTMPSQPAFYAMMNNTNISGTAAIVFEDVYVNRGSHYNSTNGRFTAPIAGTYTFSANFLKRSGSGRLLFHKNDTYYGSGNSQVYAAAPVDTPLAATIIITLSVGDYVTVVASIDSGDAYGNSNSHNGFSGYLLG